MTFSPAEKQARKAYREELLKKNPYFKKSSLNSYVGGLSVNSDLTAAVRQAGLLPENVESLLQLTDPERIQTVARWWEEEGLAQNAKHQAAMNHWLAHHDTLLQQPAKKRTSVRSVPLAVPPHTVRLLTLLQAFFPERNEDFPLALYEELLRILTGSPGFFCSSEDLKEHTPAFRSLRSKILRQLENKPDKVSAALLEKWPPKAFAQKCRTMAVQCLSQYAAPLLSDFQAREDSLLHALCLLYDAPVQDCPARFLALIRRLLNDCDPLGFASPPPSGTFSLWESGLIWQALEHQPPSEELLTACLRLPGPAAPHHRERWAADLFQAILPLCAKPHHLSGNDKWAAAEMWLGTALRQLDKNCNYLQVSLPHPQAAWHRGFSSSQLWDGAGKCILRGWLQLRLARLLLDHPADPTQKDAWGHRLMQAQELLRQTEQLLLYRLDDHQSAAIRSADEQSPYLMLTDTYLLYAQTYLQLSRLETEENCLADAVNLYMRPARLALDNARDCLEFVPAEEIGSARAAWERMYADCHRTFFQTLSPVVSRLRLRTPGDAQAYETEFSLWKARFPSRDLPAHAPHVSIPLDPESLRNQERFETVYCGSFDSVPGQAENQKFIVELTLFQLLAGGKTSLLQMNQIVDNRVMLQMLTTPGFRQACRQGYISLSCFAQINSPRDYLLSCLEKDGFRFSSSHMYDMKSDHGPVLRELMARYLDPDSPVTIEDFPWEWREEAEFLIESYQMLFECFQPSDLLRYHQNTKLRYPPARGRSAQPVIQSLPTVLDQRLKQLTYEAQNGGTQNLETLSALEEYSSRWSDLTQRSLYDNVIDQAMEQAGAQERLLLAKFRKLVYDSYFLSNGRRSSRTVLLTEDDPDLILTGDASPAAKKEMDTLSKLFRQRYDPCSDSNLIWPDVCQIASSVREVDIRDSKLSTKLRAKTKSRLTGFNYTSHGRDTYVSGLKPTTSENQTVSINSAEAGSAHQALEFHKMK